MTTTVTLFPGTITTMLGSPTVDTGAWSDATDDTTSADLSQSWNGTTFTRFDRVKGLLPILDSSLGTPEAIRVRMRASGFQSAGPPGDPLDIQANIALTNTPNSPFVRVGDTNQSGALHWQVTANIGITGDFSVDLASDAPIGGFITGGDFYAANFTTMAAVVTMLQASGAVLQAQVDILTPQSHTLSNTLVIYALWVEADFPDAGGAATVAPPLRQYPRNDGLGASTTRRVWPVPNTIQASNRRGPSAIL